MNYYLSRLGRTTFGQHAMPTLSVLTFGGYLAVHCLGHDVIRKIFIADGPDGQPAKVSDYLRDMITNVFSDVEKGGFHQDVFELKNYTMSKPTIRWYVSSTLDPVVYGMADFKTGMSVGVPISYNYTRPDDIPDSAFEIKKISLFRSLRGSQTEDPKLSEFEQTLVTKQEKEPVVLVRKIDRDSQEGKDYIDSLLLSENAKRFSIANALYLGDSYRMGLEALNILLTTTGAVVTSRAYVFALKLKDCNITQRMPGYFLSGVLYLGIYKFLSAALDESSAKKARRRATKLGEDYAAGAEEYSKKQDVRNQILGLKKK